MEKRPKYASPTAFRKALEDRLQAISKKEGIDLQRLRRQVAFDRLLARLFVKTTSPWSLKGGYAMELRTKLARATKDVDLNLRLPKMQQEDTEAIRDTLVQDLSSNLQDHFSFRIGAATMDLEAAPYGGSRYPIESVIDEKTFVKFNLDVAIGDYPDGSLEKVEGRDWLNFAGIKPATFLVVPREQQLAEKLHAYTRPRDGATNSRAKDLIDLVLLIDSKSLGAQEVKSAILKTFRRRKSHEIPVTLQPPPADWGSRFKKMAAECSIKFTLEEAYEFVREYYESLSK